MGLTDEEKEACGQKIKVGFCSDDMQWREDSHCIGARGTDNTCVAEDFTISLNGYNAYWCRKGRVTSSGAITLSRIDHLKPGVNNLFLKAYASVRKHYWCGPFYIPFRITCNADGTTSERGLYLPRGSSNDRSKITKTPIHGSLIRGLPNIGGWHSIELHRR